MGILMKIYKMIDNIEKFEAFLAKNYPETFKEVKDILRYSPSTNHKNTINVFNPFLGDKVKMEEFEIILSKYGYTPSL